MFFKLNVRRLAFLILFFYINADGSPRTVFVQLFEWPWKDIAQECETYLGPAGFSAVQVSPPHEHILAQNHPWWERYQVVSYKLTSRSGNEYDFADMVQRCKKAGIDIYVDAVLNHTTGVHGGRGFGGSSFTDYNYPFLYQYQDFHHCGLNQNDNIVDFRNRYELQNCELLGLADLATDSDYVRKKIASYLNHLLRLGVAGFRLDAAKHIPVADLIAIKAKLDKPAYFYSEVIYDANGPIPYHEYIPVGDVMAYDYAYRLARGFLNKSLGSLQWIQSGFPGSDDSIVFITNHDLERNSYSETLHFGGTQKESYRLAQIFLMAWPFGYPQLYSGYSFSNFNAGPPLTGDSFTSPVLDNQNQCKAPWTCEHRQPEVAAMVDFRNQTTADFHYDAWWSNGRDILSFSRGQAGFIAINSSEEERRGHFSTTMPDGVYCNILDPHYQLKSHSCHHGVRVSGGTLNIDLPRMAAIVLLKDTTVF